MGEAEITAFLSHLAVDKHVSASTRNQALSALLCFRQEVPGKVFREIINSIERLV